MRIKKSSIDTMLILFAMVATIMPIHIAKLLMGIFLIFLLIKIIINKDIFLYVIQKIIIFVLFIPGIVAAIFVAPENLIRFVGIILIIFGFPYSSFKIKKNYIILFSCFILFYLIITQLFLLSGNQTISDLRDFFYSYEDSGIHDYGAVDNIFKNIFNFSPGTRGGGLYTNPNTFAGLVVLFFFIFDISWKYHYEFIDNFKKNKWKNIIIYYGVISLVFISLMQTKSKTFIISFLIYLIFKNISILHLSKLKLKKKFIFYLLLSLVIFSLLFDKILYGFLLESGSANIKFSILFNYLKNASLNNIFFGGIYNINFDMEYGYWFAANGLLGIIGLSIFFIMILQYSDQSKPLILTLSIISIGSTLFYNLLYISILISLLIILLSSKKNLIIN
jgi:hypothetical protein